MAPSARTVKVDPQVSAPGTGESSDTTNQQPPATQQEGLDLASDSEEEVAAGAGIERVTCPVDGCTWFQPITTSFPASEANKSAELHMLGAHNLQLGGSMAQFAASVSSTKTILQEQSASPRPPPAARMEAAPRPACKEGMSLSEWRSFLHTWELYKCSTIDFRPGDFTIVGNHVS